MKLANATTYNVNKISKHHIIQHNTMNITASVTSNQDNTHDPMLLGVASVYHSISCLLCLELNLTLLKAVGLRDLQSFDPLLREERKGSILTE